MTEEEMKQTLATALVTVAVAAAILRVAHVTIYRWLNDGTLDGVKIDKPDNRRPTYRVKSASVRRLLGMAEGAV